MSPTWTAAALRDHDHEGHSGWRIDQLTATIVAWLRAQALGTVALTHLVDMQPALTTAELADGPPDAAGYDKIAARW